MHIKVLLVTFAIILCERKGISVGLKGQGGGGNGDPGGRLGVRKCSMFQNEVSSFVNFTVHVPQTITLYVQYKCPTSVVKGRFSH